MYAYGLIQMMSHDELADIYKALAVPSRLRILSLIKNRQLCVNAITRSLNISQPAVSQHLSVLKQTGLVNGKKEGYMVHYTLNKARLTEFNRAVAEVLGDEFVLFQSNKTGFQS